MKKSTLIVLNLLCFLNLICSWHAYDSNFSNLYCNNKTNISQSNILINPTEIKLVHSFSGWRDNLNLFKQKHPHKTFSFLSYHTQALNLIYNNQHPKNCSEAKFIIPPVRKTCGFGCEIHFDGVALAIALKSGRVLIDAGSKLNSWEVNNHHCKIQNKLNKECYYEPWSSCTITDAGFNFTEDITKMAYTRDIINNDQNLKILKLSRNDISSYIHGKQRGRLPRMNHIKTLVLHDVVPFRDLIPESLKDLLKCSPVKKRFWYYWWRAISATYLLRPNKHTLSWLDTHRTLPLADNESCVAVYVRRGDKAKEMRLVSFAEYSSTAELMWSSGLVPGSEGRPTGTMFFSSEDPDVLAEAKEWAKRTGWRLLYTDVIDRNKSPARLSVPRHTGLEEEYLAMILNLEYALRCDAWVCTLASNFCRLIDELRTTVAGKADGPFADLSAETCSSPPCIGKGIKSFDW